jgi:hypothetical protein
MLLQLVVYALHCQHGVGGLSEAACCEHPPRPTILRFTITCMYIYMLSVPTMMQPVCMGSAMLRFLFNSMLGYILWYSRMCPATHHPKLLLVRVVEMLYNA